MGIENLWGRKNKILIVLLLHAVFKNCKNYNRPIKRFSALIKKNERAKIFKLKDFLNRD